MACRKVRRLSVGTVADGIEPCGLGPEAGEWLQQATLAVRARVPLEVLSDTIQPFPSFSGIYDTAVKALRMEIADRPKPVGPMNAQIAGLSR